MIGWRPRCVRPTYAGAIVLAGSLSIACSDRDAARCDTNIVVPNGFCATLFARDVGPARHLAVSKWGTVYVALWREGQRTGGVLALRDTNRDGRADVRMRFGPEGGSGIAIRDSLLYFATWSTVYRYALRPGDMVPMREPDRVAVGMPETEHGARSIALGSDGRLYVNIGAPSNACERDYPARDFRGDDPCRELRTGGGIWAFDAMGHEQPFAEANRYATGLRHTVALTTHPNGTLYGAPHGIDHLSSWWPSAGYSPEDASAIPSETLFSIAEGQDYGFPYCMHDPRIGRMVPAPAYLQSPSMGERCARIGNPVAVFPAHAAPLALVFYTSAQFPQHYRQGLFVALHGSLFHHPLPPVGYRVAFVPFSGTHSNGAVETFATGSRITMGSFRFGTIRPSGLAVDSAGALYIADDNSGRIWRVHWRGAR